MKRSLLLTVTLALVLTVFAACSSQTTTYKDGAYVGVSDADDRGYMRAEVTIKNDKIESVKLVGLDGLGLEKTEEYPYDEYHTAIVDLAAEMKEQNTWDVDAIAKATSTSIQSKQAAQRAMAKALVEPDSTAKYFDGKFMAISDQTDRGWTIAWVDIENDTINNVVIHSTTSKTDDNGNTTFMRKDENYPYELYFDALELIPERVVTNNGTDIDAVTGATGTTEEAIKAVEQALIQAAR